MYALSSFSTIKYHPRPRVVVMLSPVSPSDFSIESNKCRAKIPDCVKALKRADIMLDGESGALFTTIVQLYPGGGPAVVTATCDNVRYRQSQFSLRLASKRGLGWWYMAMSRDAIAQLLW
jgi:hypothetical protein